MDDAVVDMFLLSMCGEIYGCSNSTFDEVASYIGGKPLNRLMLQKGSEA